MGLGKDDGTLAEQLYYNSTGLCKSWDPSGGGNWNTHPDNADYNLGRSEYIPFGYLGMYRDRFTGKYHTHFREYDPLHARWLSEDPAGYADGLNLYNAYMGVNGIDPFGLGVDIDNLTTDQMADLLTDPDSAPSEALPDDMILTRPTDLLKFREGRILLAIYLLDGSAGLSRYAPQAVAIGHELDNAVESNGEVYFSYGVTVGETKAAVRGREALEYGKQRCRTLAAEFAREGTALILSEIGGKGIQVFAKFVRAMRRSATLWKRGLGGCDDMANGISQLDHGMTLGNTNVGPHSGDGWIDLAKDGFGRNAQQIAREPGYFDVIAHGKSDAVKVVSATGKTHYNVTPDVLNRYIGIQPGYAGQNIRMISCNTGKFSDGFAAELAKKAGVKVKAPTEIIWTSPDGLYWIRPQNSVGKIDILSTRGYWKTFTP